MYIMCYTMLVQRFEPQGRCFTNFSYYYHYYYYSVRLLCSEYTFTKCYLSVNNVLSTVSGGHVVNTRSRNMYVKALRALCQVKLLGREYMFTKHVCQSCVSIVSGEVVT